MRRARTHGRVAVGDLVVGTVAGGGLVLALVLVAQPLIGLDVWGVAHVAYRLAVVGLPVGALVVLAVVVGDRRDARRRAGAAGAEGSGRPPPGTGRGGRRRSPARRWPCSPSACSSDRWGGGPARWPPTAWRSRSRPSRSSGGPSEPLRIGVLADLQTRSVGPHEQEAVDRLLAARPDLILVPGDVYQGDPGSLPDQLGALHSLLGRLHAPGGVYVVQGDFDPPGQLAQIFAGTDARLLRDEVVHLDVRDRRDAGGTRPRRVDALGGGSVGWARRRPGR